MASNSEVGHAKNIANANLLISQATAMGSTYNPTNPALQITNLQDLYNNAFAQHQQVNTLKSPYTLAVNNREQLFKTINPLITRIRKAYKATQGVTPAQVEDFMTIARKIKGVSKKSSTTTPDTAQAQHSTSQMSYDQRTNHFDEFIGFLQNTPNYAPNESDYQVSKLQTLKANMLQATQQVADTYIPLNNSRTQRNNTMYLSQDNLVNTFNLAKNYILSVVDKPSTQYSAVQRLKFIKL